MSAKTTTIKSKPSSSLATKSDERKNCSRTSSTTTTCTNVQPKVTKNSSSVEKRNIDDSFRSVSEELIHSEMIQSVDYQNQDGDEGVNEGSVVGSFYSKKSLEEDLKKELIRKENNSRPTRISPKLVAEKCLKEIPRDEEEL